MEKKELMEKMCSILTYTYCNITLNWSSIPNITNHTECIDLFFILKGHWERQD